MIKVKALFYPTRNGDEIFVSENFDKVTGEAYYRFVGGTVEFGERAIDTVVREVKEELNEDVIISELFTIIENIFVCDGLPGHEIMYIFSGKFLNKEIYVLDECFMTEADGTQLRCAWIKLADFKTGKYRLTPEGLLAQLSYI
ncbi:MAG: NUDIX hydrolase [Saprospiraceae bacterium]